MRKVVGSPPSRVITKDHHKNSTNYLPTWHAAHSGRSLAMQPNCVKGRVVCSTVYGDMHYKDLLGFIVRVIPVPDFYLLLHDLAVLLHISIHRKKQKKYIKK